MVNDIGANGFEFELLDAGVNTKYSEIGTGFFRNKLIMVSSKKLGGLAKIDFKHQGGLQRIILFRHWQKWSFK